VNLYVQRTQLETRDKQAGGPRPGLIPIVAFVDQLRPHDGNQVIVLIPLAPEGHRRSQILHSHLELVLTAALRDLPGSLHPGGCR